MYIFLFLSAVLVMGLQFFSDEDDGSEYDCHDSNFTLFFKWINFQYAGCLTITTTISHDILYALFDTAYL